MDATDLLDIPLAIEDLPESGVYQRAVRALLQSLSVRYHTHTIGQVAAHWKEWRCGIRNVGKKADALLAQFFAPYLADPAQWPATAQLSAPAVTPVAPVPGAPLAQLTLTVPPQVAAILAYLSTFDTEEWEFLDDGVDHIRDRYAKWQETPGDEGEEDAIYILDTHFAILSGLIRAYYDAVNAAARDNGGVA